MSSTPGTAVIDPEYTSSKTGTLYFAFGSNLSAHQMSIRLTHSPNSSIPVAIGRLESHKWIICERGYSNVVAVPGSSSSDETTVWGVLYNMDPFDEVRLDVYEGHNTSRNPNPTPVQPADIGFKKFEQDGWDYNKHYLPITVTKWLRDPAEYGIVDSESQEIVRALVYVDEFRVTPGVILNEYIGRMNRGIEESVKLGLPQSWVDKVLRPFIPSGVYVEHVGYVGTDEGWVAEMDDRALPEKAVAAEMDGAEKEVLN